MPKQEKLEEAPNYLAEIISVNVRDLFVDHRYQRGVKKSSVRNLVNNWTWKQYIPIIVSPRGGSGVSRYAIIDGQQRFMAAQEIGIEKLPAIMLVAASLDDEAELFVGANTGASVGAGDRFKAQFLRKEPRSIAIAAVVEASGFSLGCLRGAQGGNSNYKGDPFTIEAVGTIENLYDMGYLTKTLDTISESFGDAPVKDMVTGPFLHGVYLALRHLARFEVPREELVKSMQRTDVKELLNMGHDRYKSMVSSRSISGGIAAVIVEQFNYRKRADQVVPAYDRSAARALIASAGAKSQVERGTLFDVRKASSPESRSKGGRASSARNPRTVGRFARKEE